MPMRMLAVAFGPPTMAAAYAGLERIRDAKADCVELRLDFFEEAFELDVLLRERGDLAVVATLRPPSQGGKSTLEPRERVEVLVRAAELGADYVDLESLRAAVNVADRAMYEQKRIHKTAPPAGADLPGATS